jgi:hypothetical protein
MNLNFNPTFSQNYEMEKNGFTADDAKLAFISKSLDISLACLNDELYNIRGLANKLGTTRTTIYNMIETGEIVKPIVTINNGKNQSKFWAKSQLPDIKKKLKRPGRPN